MHRTPAMAARFLGRRSARRVAASILVFFLGATATAMGGAIHGPPAEAVVTGVLGCHDFSGGAAERAALEGAIDAVVDEFSFLVRPIVRSRLGDANPVASRICIERRGDDLTVSMDARNYRAPSSGKAVKVKGVTGDELMLHLEVREGRLSQVFEKDDGGRVNAFRPTKTGLDLRVRVFSDRLPKDLTYRLTYRRTPER